jgi:PAS domain S-box-containing protein
VAGEAAALIAGLGQHNFPLGAFAEWPPALRTAVNMMLASRFPMFIAWGPDLPYLYNDACIPIIGARHPQAFGRPFREVWPDVWDNLSPLLARALAGEASYHENLPLTLARGSGPEPAWFTFSYSPLFDEAGIVRGVLSVAVESTQAVLAERRHALRLLLDHHLLPLADPAAIIAAAADVAMTHLGVQRAGYADIDADSGHATPTLDRGRSDRILLADRYDIAAFGPAFFNRLVAGQAARIDNGRAADLSETGRSALDDAGIVGLLVVPLVKDGRLVAALYAASAQPRHWTDEDEESLRDIGERSWAALERARAEARLAESERELQQMTDALPVLISHVDAEGRYRFNNRAYEEWFGHPRADIYGRTLREVLGEQAYVGLRPFVERALAGEAMSLEQLVPYKDGGERFIHVDYVPRVGARGQTEGFYALVQDIGEQKRAQLALARSEQRLRAVLESVSDGFLAMDADMRITLFNRACEAHFGTAREQVLGRRLDEAFPSLADGDFLERLARVRDSHAPETFEAASPTLAGHVIEVRAAAKDGGGLAVSFSDITERHRAELLRQLLLNELNHRVKNTLAVVQGLAAQSFKPGVDPDTARRSFEGRLRALAAAHDLLTAENWVGASLRSVISEAVLGAADPSRLSIEGPDLQLPPQTAVTLALAIHELSTNAVKHGSLGVPEGRVRVDWAVAPATGTGTPSLRLEWVESGGPLSCRPHAAVLAPGCSNRVWRANSAAPSVWNLLHRACGAGSTPPYAGQTRMPRYPGQTKTPRCPAERQASPQLAVRPFRSPTPAATAIRTASERLRTPSLSISAVRCISTVRGLRSSRCAISLFGKPSTSPCSTASWRGDSEATRVRARSASAMASARPAWCVSAVATVSHSRSGS